MFTEKQISLVIDVTPTPKPGKPFKPAPKIGPLKQPSAEPLPVVPVEPMESFAPEPSGAGIEPDVRWETGLQNRETESLPTR